MRATPGTQVNPLHTFNDLPPEVEGRLRELIQVKSFSQGETIFFQDDDPDAIFLVASGRIKIVRVTPEGYESILCIRGMGDYFCPVPPLDSGVHLRTAIAMTYTTLFQVVREEFLNLCTQSSELLSIVQGDCLSEVRLLLNRLEAFAFRGVRQRLAITLMNEVNRQTSETVKNCELRFTHHELAGLVGASRESVSRNLSNFEKEGILVLGRGRLTIKNLQRLEELMHEGRK